MKPIESVDSIGPALAPEVKRTAVPKAELCVITEWCKGCGFCIEFCTKDVLAADPGFNRKGYHPPRVVNAEACTNCGTCEMICPDFAIFTVDLAADASGADEEAGR
jgi:2-oxoglutarate ferredoxin oxidoreductase subunit delta